jgi:hypothetical protein
VGICGLGLVAGCSSNVDSSKRNETGDSGGNPVSAGGASGGSTATTGGTSSGGATNQPSGGTGVNVDPIDPVLEPGSCGLDEPAFCETFETVHPGGRGADLDESIWSFARYGHPETLSFFLRGELYTQNERLFPATFCGAPFSEIFPGDDVKFCEGVGVDGTTSMQLNEVMDDEGDFGFNSMRIRQPFDFTDRTGKIVWDVDAKVNPLNLGHGWWIEVWITEDPAPMPYHQAPTVAAFPRAGVGFAFQFGSDCPETETEWNNALETVTVTQDYKILHSIPFWEFANNYDDRCFRCADGVLNHLELHITQDKAELLASDPGDPDSLRVRSVVEGLDLPFSRGYVHFQHAAYNAPKDGNVTGSQTFRWDNIGFDGPTYPTPRSYDVPDNEGTHQDKVLTAYHLMGGETQSFAGGGQVIDYRFNGGSWHNFTIQTAEGHGGTGMRTFSVAAPLEELNSGENTIEVRFPEDQLQNDEMIGNLDLTIEATP